MTFTHLWIFRILIRLGQGYRDDFPFISSESRAINASHAPEEIPAASFAESPDLSLETSTMSRNYSTYNVIS